MRRVWLHERVDEVRPVQSRVLLQRHLSARALEGSQDRLSRELATPASSNTVRAYSLPRTHTQAKSTPRSCCHVCLFRLSLVKFVDPVQLLPEYLMETRFTKRFIDLRQPATPRHKLVIFLVADVGPIAPTLEPARCHWPCEVLPRLNRTIWKYKLVRQREQRVKAHLHTRHGGDRGEE